MRPASKDHYLHDRLTIGGSLGPNRIESEQGLRDAIIQSLPVGLTVQDDSGNYLLVNDAAAAHYDIAFRANVGPHALASLTSELLNISTESTLSRSFTAGLVDRIIQQRNGKTLLSKQRSVSIGGQSYLISASVDVSELELFVSEHSRRAEVDELTKLPKRAVIQSSVEDAIRSGGTASRFALVFLDLDNFKHINDYYGHGAGDALLVKLAEKLKHEIRQTDLLARIGGDEFLLLLNPVTGASEVMAAVDHLLQRLKAPVFIDGFEAFASASIGVSIYPEHGNTYGELRQKADTAMYSIKNDIKGSFALFDEVMEKERVTRTQIEQSLRLAILEKRFRCAYQPKVDIRTRDIVGVEALVRLYNEHGVIQAPGEFIELATELGLIDELTHLVLEDIVSCLDLIDDTFGVGIKVSFNVAAKQACNRAFMSSLLSALAQTECPERFIIEVTEDAFVRKSQFQAQILPELREIGVGVSIDDFGTGYSSLSALAEITADEIKIDRSFITDVHNRPRSQAILRAITSLSEALGMTVIAEGVEFR